jgi:hypothetical protein
MAALFPAIHVVFAAAPQDARDKRKHERGEIVRSRRNAL